MKPKKNFTLIKVLTFTIGLLVACTTTQAQVWSQLGNDIDGVAAQDSSGYSVSLSADGSVVAIGSPRSDASGFNNSGTVRIYENQGGTWTQLGNNIEGLSVGEQFGYSVSLSSDGSVVAVGAPYNDVGAGANAGQVRVYENQGGSWTKIGDDIDGEAAEDLSGKAVSLNSDGSVVAIGAPENDGNADNAGHVRIYENQSGTWSQIGSDIDGETASDESGTAVSLSSDGSVVAIGAPENSGSIDFAGHVRIYENQSGTWTQIGNDIDGEASYDESGTAVSLNSDGSVVAIGADGNDENGTNSGHVRIYENQSGTWTQIGNDIDGEASYDESGTAVSLSSDGSVVAIGAPENDGNGSNAGHIRIYENQSGTWTQTGDDIDGEAAEDKFGTSVSISSSGSVFAGGAPLNDGSGENAGHTRIYNYTDPCFNITSMNLSQEYTGTLGTSGVWENYTDCDWTEPGEEQVYQFTTTDAGEYELIAEQISGDPDFYLMTACDPNSTNVHGECWGGGTITENLEANTTYYIIVDNFNNGSEAEYSIQVNPPSPCEDIITMNLSQEYTGTLGISGVWDDYTDCDWTEPGEEQVYQFTTTDAGEYELIAEQISGDPDFYLMTACDPNSTNVHGDCWDNETITENLEASTTYYIIVDNFNSDSEAEFSIQVNPPSPCEDIISMNLSQEYTGTLGTSGVWEDYTDCYYTESGEEQVYQFTTAEAGEYELIAEQISGDPDFYLMTACDPNSTNVHGDCWGLGTITENLDASTTYYIIVDNYNDDSEAEFSIQVSFATGLTEPDKQSFSVYPNPAESKINIQMSHNINKAFVKMENALGKQLIEKHIHSKTGEIDVSHLKPGIYFINLNTEKGKLVKKVIIK